MTAQFKLLIHQHELDQLARWVLEYPAIETGGNLFGFWTNSQSPVVQMMLGPGPEARHHQTAFYQDSAYLSAAGGALQERFGLQHLGDWHSHHRLGLRRPSSGDVNTVREVLRDTSIGRFMLFIATIRAEDSSSLRDKVTSIRHGKWVVEVGAFLYEKGSDVEREGRWVVLPGPSPVTETAHQEGRFARPRATKVAWSVPETTLATPIGELQAPPPGWYTLPWGNTFLVGLHQQCAGLFRDFRMLPSPKDGSLTCTFGAEGLAFGLWFPPDFPDRPVELLAREGDHEVLHEVLKSTEADEFVRGLRRIVAGTSARLGGAR